MLPEEILDRFVIHLFQYFELVVLVYRLLALELGVHLVELVLFHIWLDEEWEASLRSGPLLTDH